MRWLSTAIILLLFLFLGNARADTFNLPNTPTLFFLPNNGDITFVGPIPSDPQLDFVDFKLFARPTAFPQGFGDADFTIDLAVAISAYDGAGNFLYNGFLFGTEGPCPCSNVDFKDELLLPYLSNTMTFSITSFAEILPKVPGFNFEVYFPNDPPGSDGVIPNWTITAVPPVSAVPEPSTWAMMLLGFAGIGFMAYRRNAKPLMAA
jgi:PEP-CTERM motif